MRILIIGGTGFIGSYITRYLLSLNYEVILFNRGKNPLFKDVLQINGSKEELHLFTNQLMNLRPDAIIHTIAYTERDALQILTLLKNVSQRLILLSSADVYDAYLSFKNGLKEHNLILNENSLLRSSFFPYRVESNYIEDLEMKDLYFNYDKIIVENTIKEQNLDYTIFRLAAVYGPNDPQRKLQKYIDDVLRGKDQIMNNDQLNWRWTRIYVENIPPAIHMALNNKKSSREIYNLGELKAQSQSEIYTLIKGLVKKDSDTVLENMLATLNENKFNYKQHLIMDSSKIRDELGYKEIIEPELALVKTIKASPLISKK